MNHPRWISHKFRHRELYIDHTGISPDVTAKIVSTSPQNSPAEVKCAPTTDAVSGDDEEKAKSIDGKPCPGNRSGNNGLMQLWQFLLKLSPTETVAI
ncbi:GA-binding protein alpha chain-like isoform X2 [Montipora capricornis]|uniref:GA-binding protein alpha chain-like isoform X2 n=1 Tax=Montipora capricornis TaxID=246305 RepID=UPI0035F2198C